MFELSAFARFELSVRLDRQGLVVEIRDLPCAVRLVILIGGQEVPLTTLHENNELTLTAAARNAKLVPVPLDPNSEIQWTVDKDGIVALFPVAGTPTCKLGYVGIGSCTVTAKASLGALDIFGSIDIQTIAAQATHLEITASAETPLP